MFLLFPAGRLLGPRWRFPAALLIGGGAVASLGYAFTSEEAGENFASGRNPVAIDALPTLLLFDIGIVAVMVGTAAAVAAILIRLRRARGVERQQLKWFAFAASAVLAVVPFAIALWYETFAVQVVMSLALMMLPLATGVAILRYRLYDIDVVIRRTLTYAVLTATLVGAYLACVLLAQLVLPSGSDLTVALSTVAVAAVFNPARRWIQSTVDRRFFRRSYDVQQTLMAFGARVRDQVDLEALSHDSARRRRRHAPARPRLPLAPRGAAMTYAIAVFNVLVFVAGVIIAGAFSGLDTLFLGMTIVFGATGRGDRSAPAPQPARVDVPGDEPRCVARASSRGRSPWLRMRRSSRPTPRPAGFLPMVPGLTFLLLLFPDGRPLSPRWRRGVWVAGVGLVLMLSGTLTKPGPLEDYPEIENPLGWSGYEPFEAIGTLMVFAAIVCGVVSLVSAFVARGHSSASRSSGSHWRDPSPALDSSSASPPSSWSPSGPGARVVIYGEMMARRPVAAGGRRCGDAAVPALRHRCRRHPRDSCYTALTATLVAAYLLTVLVTAARAAGAKRLRRRALDACGGRGVRACATADPGGGRSALLPSQLRRGEHAGDVRSARPRGGRPRCPHR